MKYYLRVLPYLKPYWPLAIISMTMTMLMAVVSLIEPWTLKILVDSVLGDVPLPAFFSTLLGSPADDRLFLLISVVIAGFVIRLAQNAATVAGKYFDTKIEQCIILDFRADLFAHAQRLSFAFHNRRQVGSLIYAINSEANAAAGILMVIPPLMQSVCLLAGMFYITFRIDSALALLSLTIVPVIYFSVGYYATHIQKRLEWVKSLESKMVSMIQEALSMLRVIVAFGQEGHEHRRFREHGAFTRDKRVELTLRQTVFSLSVNTTMAAGTTLVLGFGVYKSLQGQLTIGQLLVVLAYIAAVYKPLEMISNTIGSLQDRFASLRIAFDLLDTKPDIRDAANAVAIRKSRGHICFEHVYFKYTDNCDTLRDISFEVRPGQLIGIVGPTGAGKSTLISLIPRFIEASQGRILLDGRDLRSVGLHSLRAQISLVFQEPLLFSGTIADNIRYGRPHANRDEIIAAANAANAHDFIVRLPNQYESEVGERGVLLSGGERQRICLARAFLREASILLLDEPTSFIDSKTEALILEALDRLIAGHTSFMIAHRLSTLRNADLILVLNDGKIIESGTHQELLDYSGLYAQMYAMQAGQVNGRCRPKIAHEFAAVPETANGDDNGRT